MKMKLSEAQMRVQNLLKMGKKTFPAKLSYSMSRNIEKLQKEVEILEKERKKICEQYCEKDEEGKPVMTKSIVNGRELKEYKFDEVSLKIVNEEYEAMLETEVDIEIKTVKTDVIEQCESAERYTIPTVADLVALSFMLED